MNQTFLCGLLAAVLLGLGQSPLIAAPPIVITNAEEKTAAIEIDGKADDWTRLPAVEIGRNGTRLATVRLALRDRHLLACFEVVDESPMMNRGQDPPNHFKEGDALDLYLGPWRDDPQPQPIAGDLRLLVVPFETAPVAYLYRPVAQDADEHRQAKFWSPVRSIVFDEVKRLTNVDIAIGRTDTGYVGEFAIPVDDLHLDFSSGSKLLGDVGVLYSNDGGMYTAHRSYYYATGNTTVSDLPTEAELRPAQWGRVMVRGTIDDRNCAKEGK